MDTKKNPAQDVHRMRGLFFLVGICTSLGLTISAFQWNFLVQPKMDRLPKEEVEVVLYNVPSTFQPPPPTPPKAKVAKQQKSSVIIEASEDAPLEAIPSDLSISDTLTYVWTEPEPEDTGETIFVGPEQMPVPEGGYEKFYETIAKNLKYPRQAIRAQVEGKVFVQFTIRKDGSVTDLSVLKGIGYGCDEEALRVLNMVKWSPGKQRGKPVHVKMVQPLVFRMP
jgi:periplasmic protein TonB